jgi:hypothetical protein
VEVVEDGEAGVVVDEMPFELIGYCSSKAFKASSQAFFNSEWLDLLMSL